ncbi:MAG TPA: P-loop NTPase fold protein [Solirubrobacteraceae bacterium]|jgi:hypothetical protein|nr:P-loop NTPase fold protein [Solirubrobacteraceae bacterium]
MFERFTERARQVIVLAREEAGALNYDYIGTEHILLGLLREQEGLAARALESLGITLDRVRAQVLQIVGPGEEVTSGQIPFTPLAKKVLERALQEALILGDNYVGTEHILLGLTREQGVYERILLQFDVDPEKVRKTTRSLIMAEVPSPAPGPGGSQTSRLSTSSSTAEANPEPADEETSLPDSRSRSPRFRGDLPDMAADIAEGEDMLDIDADVRAIANIVAAKALSPPLSIGLFGDWGSGKSFFIGLVQTRVRQLAFHSRNSEQSNYCGHIRNITFNAWHYSDANLWASLVTHIFDELGQPEPKTSVTDTETAAAQLAWLEARLAENSTLKDQLERARNRRRQVEARRNLLRWTWRLTGSQDDQSLAEIEQEIQSTRSALRLLLPGTRSRLVFLGISLTAIIGVLGTVSLVGGEVLTQSVTAAIAAVAVPFAAFQMLRKRVLKLLRQAGGFARAVDVRHTDIDKELELASAAEQQLQHELSDLAAGHRLARIAVERSGDYRQHLGLVSRIHSDFARMSTMLLDELGAHASGSTGGKETDERGPELPSIERIVLYIDDLDRCPPNRVMEVLEAIHLILAVRLFVVVVAVDPRWLLQSLRLHYAEMLTQKTQNAGLSPEEADLWGASPIDYLEKIIQVPFTLRPMNKRAATSLVHDLMGEGDAMPSEAAVEDGSGDASFEADAARTSDDLETTPPYGETTSTPPRTETDPDPYSEKEPDIDSTEFISRPIVLTDPERDFAATIAHDLRTPRAVKKFTNLYRLLRAGLDEHSGQLDRFLTGEDGEAAEYQAALILLAAIIAFPESASVFLLHLVSSADGTDGWPEFLQEWQLTTLATGLPDFLLEATGAHDSSRWTCAPFQRWALEVSRYSFTAGQEVFAHMEATHGVQSIGTAMGTTARSRS